MFDQRLFMKTLSRFSVVLPEHHDLDAAALAELTRSVTAVLGLGGSGVTMAEKGQLPIVTAVSPDSTELERSQEEYQEGPCRDAYETGEVVRVTDVRQEAARWPDYSATAARLGVADDRSRAAACGFAREHQWPAPSRRSTRRDRCGCANFDACCRRSRAPANRKSRCPNREACPFHRTLPSANAVA